GGGRGKIPPLVHGANQRGLPADIGIVEGKVSRRIGLGIGDRLHAALQLNQDNFDASAWFAGCAVIHRAVNGCRKICLRACENRQRRSEIKRNTLHRGPRSGAVRGPLGRFTPASATWSISASTSA